MFAKKRIIRLLYIQKAYYCAPGGNTKYLIYVFNNQIDINLSVKITETILKQFWQLVGKWRILSKLTRVNMVDHFQKRTTGSLCVGISNCSRPHPHRNTWFLRPWMMVMLWVSIRTSTTVGLSKWDVTLQH